MATSLGKNYYSELQDKEFTARPGYGYFDNGTILERPLATADGLKDLLDRGGLGEYESVISEYAKALGLGIPDDDLFRPLNPDDFTDAATEGVSEYWDKDLELMLKELDFSRKKLKEETEKQNKRLQENETNYDRLENKSFAQTLRDAQLGFSGRGTYDSGFRKEAVGERIDLREENLAESELGFRRDETDIADAFRLGNEGIGLNEERGRLDIDRGRQEDIERRKRSLADEQQQKNQQIYKDQFSDLLQELSA